MRPGCHSELPLTRLPATIPLYNGANLAQNEDVIVITFVYRHSIFANPLSDYVTKQNSEKGWNFGVSGRVPTASRLETDLPCSCAI